MASPDIDPYEPYLHRGLLRAGRALASAPPEELKDKGARDTARTLFDLMMETRVDRLAGEIAEILRYLMDTPLRKTLVSRTKRHLGTRAGLKLRWLGYLTSDQAVRDRLVPLLWAKEWKTREGAAQALGMIASDPVAREVLLAQIDDPDEDVQIAVVGALAGAAPNHVVMKALVGKLTHKLHVRVTAGGSLHTWGMSPALEQQIADLILDHSQPWISNHVVDVMLRDHERCTTCPLGLGNSKVIEQAAYTLLTDRVAPKRLGGAQLLVFSPGVSREVFEAARDELIALLHYVDDSYAGDYWRSPQRVREEAAHMLAYLPDDEKAHDALVQILLSEPSDDVRTGIVERVSHHADRPAAREILMRMVTDPAALHYVGATRISIRGLAKVADQPERISRR